jgi:hypothetical protein
VWSLQVSGGITMHAFKFELANVYRNLTNVVLRISPTDPVAAAKKAVLVNSHYDSTLGTKGTVVLHVVRLPCAGHHFGCCRTSLPRHSVQSSCVTDSDMSCWADADRLLCHSYKQLLS